MAEDAAPAEGAEAPEATEGGDDSGGLYDLSSVPEDVRSIVEEHLKGIEANATKKFQEHADYRKQFEPYEELGIQNLDPQAVQQLLDFAELAQDEERFAEWWKDVGDRMGLSADKTDDDSDFDFSGEDFGDLSPDKIQSMIEERVAQALEPVEERFAAGEQERLEQEAMSEVTSQLQKLKDEHGDGLDTDAVLQLAYSYVDDDPDNAIQKGFDDFQRIVTAGEASLFKKKADQPASIEGKGSANHAPEPMTDFKDASAAALERLKAANAAST